MALRHVIHHIPSSYKADKVVGQYLMVKSGLLSLPAKPALLAGCDTRGRLWALNGQDDARDWMTRAQAQETYVRHCMATFDANLVKDVETEAYHRRWEADLLAAIDAEARLSRAAGPLFCRRAR